MERKIINKVQGFRTQDGAGVSLVRVLGHNTTDLYDPFLMLDSFDSTNPEDYIAGFPMHPHRGIETISYVYKGKMVHEDSLGNTDTISDGEVQWMTAGSGILHEERIPASERLLGVQLWLNLPQKDKFAKPNYHAIRREDIKEIKFEGGYLRLLAGEYNGEKGHQAEYQPLDYYDIHIEEGKELTLKVNDKKSVFMFTLLGDAVIAGEYVKEKTAVKLSEGDTITVKGVPGGSQVLFLSSDVLGESIAWGGPIVMNTQRELMQAFTDLREGNFLRDKVEYDK